MLLQGYVTYGDAESGEVVARELGLPASSVYRLLRDYKVLRLRDGANRLSRSPHAGDYGSRAKAFPRSQTGRDQRDVA